MTAIDTLDIDREFKENFEIEMIELLPEEKVRKLGARITFNSVTCAMRVDLPDNYEITD